VAIPTDFAGLSVTVMGLGLFGGGVGAARWLASRGARVTVTDLKDAAELAESVAELAECDLTLHLGGHVTDDFTSADLVVANPAVHPDSEFLAAALSAGVPVTAEAEIVIRRCRELGLPVVGVTGSNGKSTTTAMIGSILAPRALVGGNIGGSLLGELDSATPAAPGAPGAPVVMELSSFQLHWLGEAGLSPHVAVVTNLAPNHLSWHGDVESYYAAKASILRNQAPGDFAVINHDDPESRMLDDVGAGRRHAFSLEELPEGVDGAFLHEGAMLLRSGGELETIGPADILQVPGSHNVANALAAACAARVAGAGASASEIAAGLAAYGGLPDRMETIAFWGGVRYINDSVATTPESAAASLAATEGPVVLVAGGHDKGLAFAPMALAARRKVRAAVLTGDAAGRIGEALALSAPEAEIFRAEGVAQAAELAAGLAREGETVLLSPGCSSYDEFRNYRDRAAAFRRAVERLRGEPPGAGAGAGKAGE